MVHHLQITLITTRNIVYLDSGAILNKEQKLNSASQKLIYKHKNYAYFSLKK